MWTCEGERKGWRGEKAGGQKQDGRGGGRDRENDSKYKIITLKDLVLCKQCNVCNCVTMHLKYVSMYHQVCVLILKSQLMVV